MGGGLAAKKYQIIYSWVFNFWGNISAVWEREAMNCLELSRALWKSKAETWLLLIVNITDRATICTFKFGRLEPPCPPLFRRLWGRAKAAAASLQSLAVEVRNSAARAWQPPSWNAEWLLAAVDVYAIFVMWTNQMGDLTFQIFWTSWPKKVDLRHQTLSRSLRRGFGLGARLRSSEELEIIQTMNNLWCMDSRITTVYSFW